MPADADWLVATGLSAGVRGLMSTRAGGVSTGPYASLNLRPSGLRGDTLDDPATIAENQHRFAVALDGARPVWLEQVHGVRVLRVGAADCHGPDGPFQQADASVTTERGVACTVLVADCLPVLFAAPEGRAVGAAHAGWRGLAGGVLEATLQAVCEAASCAPADVSAWLGACIGPQAFEVGHDVHEAFGAGAEAHFRATGRAGKWWADLPALARQRLASAGCTRVEGGRWCTFSEPSRFFSFRRERVTGRHAAAVWIT